MSLSKHLQPSTFGLLCGIALSAATLVADLQGHPLQFAIGAAAVVVYFAFTKKVMPLLRGRQDIGRFCDTLARVDASMNLPHVGEQAVERFFGEAPLTWHCFGQYARVQVGSSANKGAINYCDMSTALLLEDSLLFVSDFSKPSYM